MHSIHGIYFIYFIIQDYHILCRQNFSPKKGRVSVQSLNTYIEDNVYVTQWDTLSERVSDDHPLWEKNVLLQALLTAFYQSLI